MINLYILDTGGVCAEKFYPSDMTPHILKTKNKELRGQRILAHILLAYAYRDLFSGSLPELVYDRYGRPSFKEALADFNISHAGNMIALIISDEKRVGIDIESVGKGVGERLSKSVFEITRHPDFVSKRADACELFCDKTEFLALSSVGKIITADSNFFYNTSLPDSKAEDDATFKADWTLLEALVKADGRGIGAIKHTAQMLSFANIKTAFICDTEGNIYSLTAVSYNK